MAKDKIDGWLYRYQTNQDWWAGAADQDNAKAAEAYSDALESLAHDAADILQGVRNSWPGTVSA